MMDEAQAKALRAPFGNGVIETKNVGSRIYNFINHAVVTDRLIAVDPNWYWQPMALAVDGSPVIDANNGLWIRLTVCGVTRIGYGASEPHQKGADAVKTAISDALKNAAMRFGVALDLWGADSSVMGVEAVTLTQPLRSVPPLKPVETTNPELATFLDQRRPESIPTLVVPPDVEPYCPHNETACRIYKSGTSNSGKAYEGLFCQRSPYSEQCTPISLDGKPWRK